MRSLIKHWFTAATIVGILGLAMPALAQTSAAGVNPKLLSGDQTAAAIAAACGITDVRFSLELSPPTQPPPAGEFDVDVTVTGNTLAFTDVSDPPDQFDLTAGDQFNGTRGIEAVGVRRNGTHVYCYEDQVTDSGLDPPGTGVNQVTFVWGPGPCPFDDVTAICEAYNGPGDINRTVDFIQGHVAGATQPVNICGCPPAEATFCDATLPPGTAGSCIPEGQTTDFQGSEFTGSATVGTGTCEQVTTTVGGRLRTITVCK